MTLVKKDLRLTEGALPDWQMNASMPGMAHFAGTGPDGATCGGCSHWHPIPRANKQHCRKYVQLTGDSKGKPIPSSTWACRWWVKR